MSWKIPLALIFGTRDNASESSARAGRIIVKNVSIVLTQISRCCGWGAPPAYHILWLLQGGVLPSNFLSHEGIYNAFNSLKVARVPFWESRSQLNP